MPGGYASLLTPLLDDSPVLLGAAVTRIRYPGEGDRKDGGDVENEGRVKVEFVQAGAVQSLECDAVVVSVPLGGMRLEGVWM